MEILIVLIVFAIIYFVSKPSPTLPDTREPLARDDNGDMIVLKVTGPGYENGDYEIFDTPQHERLIHDGTPHRNPLVRERSVTRWWLFLPYTERVQDRYYPLTVNQNGPPDIDRIRQQIAQMKLRRNQHVEVTTLDHQDERRSERIEDNDQRVRGVTRLERR